MAQPTQRHRLRTPTLVASAMLSLSAVAGCSPTLDVSSPGSTEPGDASDAAVATTDGSAIVSADATSGLDAPLESGVPVCPKNAIVRVAAGATSSSVDPAGHVWSADTGFSGGLTLSNPNQPVQGTQTPTLYDSQRYGADASGAPASFAYTFALPAGAYEVTLKFAESWVTGPQQRLFNVAIDGTAVLTTFDIFAEAGGAWVAIDKKFPVTLSGAGQLRIDFTPGSIQSPKVDAIQIVPIGCTEPVDAGSGDDGGGAAADTGSGALPDASFPCGTPPSTIAPALRVPHGSGTTYYASPSGNDSNSGTSSSAPLTLQGAANRAGPGDTVMVLDGTYSGPSGQTTLSLNTSGNASAWIVVQAAPGAHPIITYATGGGGIWINGDYVVVDGFEVAGLEAQYTLAQVQADPTAPQYNATGIGWGNWSTSPPTPNHHIVIRNNDVHDNTASGINGVGDYVTIEYNVSRNNAYYSPYGASGISITSAYFDSVTDYKLIVRNNVTFGNQQLVPSIAIGIDNATDGNGIIVDSNDKYNYVGRTLVTNNLSFANGGTGMHSILSSHVDFVNNTAYENNVVLQNEGQIVYNDATDVNIVNNVLYAAPGGVAGGNAGNDYNLYFGTVNTMGPHDVVADPKFVDPSCNDFRLQAGSPAVDTGTSNLAPPLDLLNVSRPQGAGYDRGCYESH